MSSKTAFAVLGSVLVRLPASAAVSCLACVSAAAGALSAQGTLLEATADSELCVLAGRVLGIDGRPTAGAVVSSSAGGRAVTDQQGCYRLELRVPREATSIELTAVGPGSDQAASVRVGPRTAGGLTPVDVWLDPRGDCEPTWVPTFDGAPGMDNDVLALAVFDDGSGPALHAGGLFTTARGSVVNNIAKWDGSSWLSLGSGTNGFVECLTTWDDGGGTALYAGGNFSSAGGGPASRIAKWDGTSWSALGAGVNGTVRALAVFDDGNGAALYVGGVFTTTGGGTALRVARWDGTNWSALGSGISGGLSPAVEALVVHDDGSGPALYAGGHFANAGGVSAPEIARWNGVSWSALPGLSTMFIKALAVFDDGGGSKLYAGGSFQEMQRWNGASWESLAGGELSDIHALAVHDDGSGPRLYAGGEFTTTEGAPADRIAKWDGSTWSDVAGGATEPVQALAVFDEGGVPTLCAGGEFTRIGGVAASRVARWDGASWGRLGGGTMNGPVHALAVLASDLHVGGEFTFAGGSDVDRIVKWSGAAWSAFGTGVNDVVKCCVMFNDGGGPELYAGGEFTVAGGVPASRIAKWDGATWSPLGSGVSSPIPPDVNALAAFNDGSGPALWVGGDFTSAGGVAAGDLARWNGTSWSTPGGTNGAVHAFAVFDDGNGPALYAAGSFSTIGPPVQTVNCIARWNGTSWTGLAGGLTGPNRSVHTLAVFNDGSGPALYAGGAFAFAGGTPAERIAKWNGTSWTPLGSGIDGFAVNALAVFDDGDGPALFATGDFEIAGGVAANHIARWRASGWAPLGSGLSRRAFALRVFDDGGGPALFVGGEFGSAFDSGDSYLAKWGCADASSMLADPRSGDRGKQREGERALRKRASGRDASR